MSDHSLWNAKAPELATYINFVECAEAIKDYIVLRLHYDSRYKDKESNEHSVAQVCEECEVWKV